MIAQKHRGAGRRRQLMHAALRMASCGFRVGIINNIIIIIIYKICSGVDIW